MMTWTNVVAPRNQGNTNYGTSAARLIGGSTEEYTFVFAATARSNQSDNSAGRGTKFYQATRTNTTCYMRGLKERCEVTCNSGMPWQWRRICFTTKGVFFTPANGFAPNLLTSNGYVRIVNEVFGDFKAALYNILFKGSRNSDWTDPLIAPHDNSRVTIMYDKTVNLASGNDEGFIRMYNRWHGMNKNLIYSDDESGGSMDMADFSARGKAGMGDYYVIDLFRPRTGSSADDQLLFQPNSTLYWHEK